MKTQGKERVFFTKNPERTCIVPNRNTHGDSKKGIVSSLVRVYAKSLRPSIDPSQCKTNRKTVCESAGVAIIIILLEKYIMTDAR